MIGQLYNISLKKTFKKKFKKIDDRKNIFLKGNDKIFLQFGLKSKDFNFIIIVEIHSILIIFKSCEDLNL